MHRERTSTTACMCVCVGVRTLFVLIKNFQIHSFLFGFCSYKIDSMSLLFKRYCWMHSIALSNNLHKGLLVLIIWSTQHSEFTGIWRYKAPTTNFVAFGLYIQVPSQIRSGFFSGGFFSSGTSRKKELMRFSQLKQADSNGC